MRGLWRRLSEGHRPTVAGVLGLSALALWFTRAGNLSETDDVYAFAHRAETFPLDYVSDPRLMLYHMAARATFVGSSALGLEVSGLGILRAFSLVSALVLLVLVARIARRDLGLSATASLAASAALAASYGFWRYAVEADVYVLAMCLTAAMFHGMWAARTGSLGRVIVLGGAGGVAVLVYQPNVIPIFFAFPWMFVMAGSVARAAGFCVAGAAVVVAGYLAGFAVYWPEPHGPTEFFAFLSQRKDEFMVLPLTPKYVLLSCVRATFALGHDIAAGTWLFGVEPVVGFIRRAFYNNVIREEIFMARAHPWMLRAAPVTFFALLLASVALLAGVGRLRPVGHPHAPVALVIGLWFALEALVIGRLNPSGHEAWIVVLVPLTLIVAALVFEPLVARGGQRRIGVFLGALAIHNWVGGIAFVQNPAGELDRVRGAWAIENANDGDLVLVSGNSGFAETLRYLSRAETLLVRDHDAGYIAMALDGVDLGTVSVRSYGRDHDGIDLVARVDATLERGGRIILFEAFFAGTRRTGAVSDAANGPLARFRARCERVDDGAGLGATYLYPPHRRGEGGTDDLTRRTRSTVGASRLEATP